MSLIPQMVIKLKAAANMKIPVMLPDWVFEVWKEEASDLHASNAKFMKFKCPIFNKYVICASGFSEKIKNELKTLIESEGGTYRGDLVCGTTTHLVSNETKGSKYDHAKVWKINVVKSDWIYKSIEAKYCLPEKDFQVEESNQHSTPTDNRVVKARNIPEFDISVINRSIVSLKNENQITKVVNETENTRNFTSTSFMNNSMSNSTMANANVNKLSKNLNSFGDLIKELNLIGKIKLTLFDGIGVSRVFLGRNYHFFFPQTY